jgi:hypothetical protein
MQFLLFDVSATLVFLVGYLAVVALQERRTLAMVTMSSAPRGAELPAKPTERPEPRAAQEERRAEPCCREWPRLSAPR